MVRGLGSRARLLGLKLSFLALTSCVTLGWSLHLRLSFFEKTKDVFIRIKQGHPCMGLTVTLVALLAINQSHSELVTDLD